MGMGLLEAEEGFDLVPPALLRPGNVGPPAPKDKAALHVVRRRGGGRRGDVRRRHSDEPRRGGALRLDVGVALSRRSARIATMCGVPVGQACREAKERIDEWYDRAISQYQARAGTTTAGRQGDRVGAAGAQGVGGRRGQRHLRVGDRLQRDAALSREGHHQPPIRRSPRRRTSRASAASPRRCATRSATSSARTSSTSTMAGNSYSYDYVNHRAREQQARADHVRHQVSRRAVGDDLRVDDGDVAQVLRHPVRLVARDQRRQGRRALSDAASSAPAKNIHYTTTGYVPSDILPYTKMAESAFEEFGRKLAGDFGISIAKPATPTSGTRRRATRASAAAPTACRRRCRRRSTTSPGRAA